MSWAAHDFETYVFQRHLGARVSFLAVVAGTYAPDAFTKWYVYGINRGGIQIGAENPAQFHRGWPGAGFTHSIVFCIVIGLLAWLITRHRGWGLGAGLGAVGHVITDTSDTVGCMLFFPLSLDNFSFGLWAYAAETGRYDDAGAYYGSLGVVMDFAWMVIVLLHWRVLTAEYFRSVVAPADPAWAWLGKRMPEVALLAVYRTAFFYGASRMVFWTVWSHVVYRYPWDLSLGGPSWVEAIHL